MGYTAILMCEKGRKYEKVQLSCLGHTKSTNKISHKKMADGRGQDTEPFGAVDRVAKNRRTYDNF